MKRNLKREKQLHDETIQFRQWKKWRRERFDALLAAGPYGEATTALLVFFKVAPSSAALVDFVKSGPWAGADANVRFEILSLLDAMIVKRRVRMDLAPFDDTLPGSSKRDNVFLILREYLFPPDGGAARGVARFDETRNSKNTRFSYGCVDSD